MADREYGDFGNISPTINRYRGLYLCGRCIVATDVSVWRMFLASVIQKLLAGTMLMATIYVISKIQKPTKGLMAGLAGSVRLHADINLKLFLLIVFLGCIYGGSFTLTEAAAVAAVYAFLVATLDPRDLGV